MLGEGPVWDERQGALLWVDIEGRRLWRYGGAIQDDGTGGELASWELPKRPGSFALRKEGPGFLFAFEDGFALYDPTAEAPAPPQYLGKEQYVEGCEPYHMHGQVRLNDGRCDRQGTYVRDRGNVRYVAAVKRIESSTTHRPICGGRLQWRRGVRACVLWSRLRTNEL